MPLFEYECNECQEKREVLLRQGDNGPKLCECGGDLRKLFSSHSAYSIKGDNSASVTPKKYRGGK